MQYFALDLSTLCTNMKAFSPHFPHNLAVCPNYAEYRAYKPLIPLFCRYYKTTLQPLIKVILQYLAFEMQRFAKLCITMHYYDQQCTDSILDLIRAKCLGSDSPCSL